MTTTSPGVLVAHSDPAVLRRLCAALPAEVRLVGTAGSTASALALAGRSPVDVAVVGCHTVGDMAGVVRDLGATGCDVVLVVEDADDPLCADLVLLGASGVVPLDEVDTLPACLHAVLRGEPALPRRMVGRLLEEYRLRDRARTAGPASLLTEREAEVVELLRRGHRTQEIADRLVIAPVTVRTHIASAIHKLHVHTRAEAVRAVTAGAPAAGAGRSPRRPD
ncbi:response regulator transcription factor [Actinotalea sp. Marseille-Q4924]|uniref:response regulator transcription factor n=1 Tax=Actinotalea sp. Marseille-Q4924 TaxID=2866571 RepID=UPI001CE47A2D|nr:response regulator transcription factor [Actinotalea sp. Marseille-Q4924]